MTHEDPKTCEGRVLIVDDEANMRRVLSALVRRDGFETVEAQHGVAALEMLDDADIDAVLTDLKMPLDFLPTTLPFFMTSHPRVLPELLQRTP